MYRQTCTKLLQLSDAQITEWLNSFDAVITDCDCVLWIEHELTPYAAETVSALQALGKKVYFCTNSTTATRKAQHEKAELLGFQIAEHEIITAAHSTAAHMKNHGQYKRVYLIGCAAIAAELAAVGIAHTPIGPDVMHWSRTEYFKEHFHLESDIDAVVVAFDEHFSFPKMAKAATYLRNPSCDFIATNMDENYTTLSEVRPDVGSMVRAVEACSGRSPLVIGKPNSGMCEWLVESKLIEPARTLMIGDRCNTDILLGYNCGFQTLLVGTGIHRLEDVALWQQSQDATLKQLIPDFYVPMLGNLLPFLKNRLNAELFVEGS